MGISLLGLLMNDLNFIFVTRFFRYAPGGYWFLLVGPIIEGSVGGMGSSSHSLEHGHHIFVQVWQAP